MIQTHITHIITPKLHIFIPFIDCITPHPLIYFNFECTFQCFDHNADLREMHPQTSSPVTSTNSTAIGHGPPPSYEAVVAMDQEADGCDKCAKRRCRRATLPTMTMCSCPMHKFPAEDEGIHQILNVGDLHHGRHSVHYTHSPELSDVTQMCHSCNNQMDSIRTLTTEWSCVDCNRDADNNEIGSRESSESESSTERTTSATDNTPEDIECDQNGNNQEINQQDEDNGNSTIQLNTINNNGLIRVDMSQIIDQTGLPTYEAALKLESSGYV